MPKVLWDKVRSSTWDEPIRVTVRAVDMSDPSSRPVTGAGGAFTIAPVVADGSMIYWAAVGEYDGQAWLEGFRVGDAGVVSALEVPEVALRSSREQGGQL